MSWPAARDDSRTLVGCADSRVSPEHIFDTGLGQLFVIRLAGNVFSPEVVGRV